MARDQLLGSRYRLVRELGKGGMGQVWEARDERLGRPIAVKVISLLAGGGSRGDEARARFQREAKITAGLHHPNIVTVHDLGETGPEDDRAPFLVMEMVRGEGLDEVLRRGAVGLPKAAKWAAQICDALAEAHGAGILHRDIKPSNILITSSDAVKVLDFGIARAADPYATADRLTRTGFIVGTPPYMAPEQARGLPEPASDLYALGCLLFELITGRLPFEAPDTVGYLSAHLTQDPPTPSSVSTGIPPVWDDLLLILLRKDPAKRYPNAAALALALRQLDHARPEPGPPAGRPTTSATVHGKTSRTKVVTQPVASTAEPEPLGHRSASDGPGASLELPLRRSVATTATIVTASVCLLTGWVIPAVTYQAVGVGAMASDSQTVQMTLWGALTVVLAVGVLLLLARNTVGRWPVATAGIGLALQAVQPLFFVTTVGPGLILQGLLPVTAVTAALCALLTGFSATEPGLRGSGPRRRPAWLIAATTIVTAFVVWVIGYMWSTTW
ncbi:serine/threonine-protein kinase [Streptomyces sp. NPDC079189]|uniref:serine/threonine-protein kinase n=1 Tax=Streptomyces sp. NPDC079189 TaxID=3154514 RepID=UPI003413CAD9